MSLGRVIRPRYRFPAALWAAAVGAASLTAHACSESIEDGARPAVKSHLATEVQHLQVTAWTVVKAANMQQANADPGLPVDKLKCKWMGKTDSAAYDPVVLVACGSFNPPTIMHLRMCELAADALAREGRSVLGAYLSPVNDAYGKVGLVSAFHRLNMCKLAAQASPLVMVDAWEATRTEYVRTLAVLDHIQHALNEQMGAEPAKEVKPIRTVLVCGADLLKSFLRPGVWIEEQIRKILGDHGIVCIAREGEEITKVLQEPGTLLHEYRNNIAVVDDPIHANISSSLLRKELALGRTIRYLTTDNIIAYMEANRLYNCTPVATNL